MRIATNTIYDQSTNAMNRQQSALLKVGSQISSGKKVNSPSDDPLATSKALAITQSAAVNEQMKTARVSVRNGLGQEESVLNSVSDALISAKTSLIKGSTGTLTDADRSSIATDLQGILDTILGQANAADGSGSYLFAGYKTTTPPFVKDASGNITYVGDNGVAAQQVDSARLMSSSDTGDKIFQSVTGTATMVARAAGGNTGTATFTTPAIDNTSDPSYRQPFSIVFSDNAGVTQYSVNGGPAVNYVAGDKITANGMSLNISGQPAVGDTITVNAGGATDIFASLKSAIDALKSPTSTQAQQAALANTLNSVANELSNNLDNVLTVRASVGTRLNELDVIDTVGQNRSLNYTESVSDLIDLDYNDALSEYSLRQIGLQASQKAFVDVQSMSLFNFLK
ncbi:flagellar hook-associated protein FlgL [Pseudomonas serbica]|uniref:flagellar hook-associated protein FlgL n=1 Tax=Pseudomonas serbica TaxID=2965074 RepID=UPI00237BB00A|nr:flagellar hook-associated protein FlgL [Pseudomonas serbica]